MLWGYKPVEQQAAYGLAVQKLKRLVHLGLLLPGEKMPPERKLAEQFSISRVTLREALRVMEADGYVTIRRGAMGGAFVADEGRLRDMAQHHISGNPSDALRVFEYRLAVEPIAARLAAIRRSPADLKRLDEAMAALRESTSVGELRRGEAAFHLAIGQASGNRFMATSLEDALADLFIPLSSRDPIGELEHSLMLRDRVAAAILNRQEDDADHRMAIVIDDDRKRLPLKKVA